MGLVFCFILILLAARLFPLRFQFRFNRYIRKKILKRKYALKIFAFCNDQTAVVVTLHQLKRLRYIRIARNRIDAAVQSVSKYRTL
jgi:hypothetical protein